MMRVMMVIDNDVLRSIRRARALFWVWLQPPTWWLHWVLPAHLFFGITKEKENSGFGVAWIGGRWMVTTAVDIFFLNFSEKRIKRVLSRMFQLVVLTLQCTTSRIRFVIQLLEFTKLCGANVHKRVKPIDVWHNKDKFPKKYDEWK